MSDRPGSAGLRAPQTLHRQQMAFARHLRDPASAPPPEGLEERRLQVYRELFYNNIEGLLAGAYPVSRRLLGDVRWHALVREFFREHRATTPLFPEVARELLRYLQRRVPADRDAAAMDLPDFLIELAHYEWVELALDLDEVEFEDGGAVSAACLLDGVPLLSPLAWPLAYRYPVHRVSAEFQPSAPPDQPTFLLLQRDAGGKVRFSQIEAVGYALLTRIGANHDTETPMSGRALLTHLAAECAATDVDDFIAGGAALMGRLSERKVLTMAAGA